MRKVVVLPQPDGPSMTKNSPSRMVKLESVDGGEVAEVLLQIPDLDFSHGD